MIRTILYFGSFNPVHNGHTTMARYVMENGYGDNLEFIVSPSNPLKHEADLAPDTDRLEMVNIAIADRLSDLPAISNDVEFRLPRPSYTIDTLDYLTSKNPDTEFSILGGADLMDNISRWKDYRRLLADYHFLIYPRQGSCRPDQVPKLTFLTDAPCLDISSTKVREKLLNREDISSMVSPGVLQYIQNKGLWKTK